MKINWLKVVTYPIVFFLIGCAIATAYLFFSVYNISTPGFKLHQLGWIGFDLFMAWGIWKIGREWS